MDVDSGCLHYHSREILRGCLKEAYTGDRDILSKSNASDESNLGAGLALHPIKRTGSDPTGHLDWTALNAP